MTTCSSVSRISFRGGGGSNFFMEKWLYLHGAKRHAARTWQSHAFARGFGGMPPRNLSNSLNKLNTTEIIPIGLPKKSQTLPKASPPLQKKLNPSRKYLNLPEKLPLPKN